MLFLLVLLCVGTLLNKGAATFAAEQPDLARKIEEDIQSHYALIEREGYLNESVCYEELDLGCFYSDSGPLSHIHILPETPEFLETKYFLYNKNFMELPYVVDFFAIPDIDNEFLADGPTFFVSHGFMSNGDIPWVINMTQILVEKYPNFNLVSLDWRKGSDLGSFNYPQAVANSELCGRQFANMILHLHNTFNLKIADVHMTGHSLGAQLISFASDWIQNKTGEKPGRMTGIDPAHPMFYDQDQEQDAHLGVEDGEFVEIIHTDGGILLQGHLGTFDPVGHVDFYPNGGQVQPGCWELFDAILNGTEDWLCNHQIGRNYYYQSVDICEWKGIPCEGVQDYEEDFLRGTCSVNCGEDCATLDYDGTTGQGSFYFLSFPKNIEDKDDPLCGNTYRVGIQAGWDAAHLNNHGSFVATISDDTSSTAAVEITRADDSMDRGEPKSLIFLDRMDTGLNSPPVGQLKLEMTYYTSETSFPSYDEWPIVEAFFEDGQNKYYFCGGANSVVFKHNETQTLNLGTDHCTF